jgi:bifunctional NMN adenylyltransferase/nudix hydrolase
MVSVSVVLGRFQPVHEGHRRRIQEALDTSSHVIVVIGSAERAPSIRNPFSWSDRAEMIRRMFSDRDNDRLHFLSLRDYFHLHRWAKTLAKEVHQLAHCLNDGKNDVTISYLGEFEDPSQADLPEFATWTFGSTIRCEGIDGCRIREQLLAGLANGNRSDELMETFRESLNDLNSILPQSTKQWLLEHFDYSFWHRLTKEWRTVKAVKKAWSTTPYPPVFVTVDCVVRCKDQILLIRRKHPPGEGLWALPGGFIEADERIFKAALRELGEETQLWLSEEQASKYLRASEVFDHPKRSLIGRVITHAFYFDLGEQSIPQVQFADDAATAEWTAFSKLPSLEAEFHDDHFFILDRFLQLLPP